MSRRGGFGSKRGSRRGAPHYSIKIPALRTSDMTIPRDLVRLSLYKYARETANSGVLGTRRQKYVAVCG